jgi:hypothetical protein
LTNDRRCPHPARKPGEFATWMYNPLQGIHSVTRSGPGGIPAHWPRPVYGLDRLSPTFGDNVLRFPPAEAIEAGRPSLIARQAPSGARPEPRGERNRIFHGNSSWTNSRNRFRRCFALPGPASFAESGTRCGASRTAGISFTPPRGATILECGMRQPTCADCSRNALHRTVRRTILPRWPPNQRIEGSSTPRIDRNGPTES